MAAVEITQHCIAMIYDKPVLSIPTKLQNIAEVGEVRGLFLNKPDPERMGIAKWTILCEIIPYINYASCLPHLLYRSDYEETTFSPITEQISVVIKNIRQKLIGSLKTNIPIKTVPTAPMPVHTA